MLDSGPQPPTSSLIMSFEEATSLHLLLLRVSGLLISNRNLISNLLRFCSHLSECLLTVSYVWTIISAEGSDRYDFELIAETVGHCGGHSRFLILYLNRERLAGCVRASRDLWDELDGRGRETVAQYVTRSIRLARFYGGICGFMCIAYIVTSQIAPMFEVQNENTTVYRSLPYAFVVEVHESPWYELAFVLQILWVLWACAVTTGVDTTAPFLIMTGCGHLSNLGLALDRVALAADWRQAHRDLIGCIRYHQRILMLCQQIDSIMSFVFLFGLISTTYNISLIGLKIIGNEPEKLKYVAILGIFLVQLLVCQWAPDILLTQSKVLAEHAFFVPRHLGYEDRRVGQLLQIILARCQKPIQLRAAGYIELSMECFGSLMTSALSFFTVLNRLN